MFARHALRATVAGVFIMALTASACSSSPPGQPGDDQSTAAQGSSIADPSPDEIPPPSPRPLKPFPNSLGQPVPLQRTEPEDGSIVTETPPAIQLWFLIGDYDAEHTWMELRGPKGKKELGPVRLVGKRSLAADIREALPDGDYIAAWWASDDDGHGFNGTTKFTVKRPH
jgi:methionine-rich copper-binding protein CopC